jgi:hypothetical protein
LNTLKCDGPQRDRPAVCVITQQDSSTALVINALSFPQRNVRRKLPKYHSYFSVFEVA